MSRLLRLLLLSLLLICISAILVPKNGFCQLAEAPWPAFGQNNRHTGLSPYPGAQTDSLQWKMRVNSPTFSPVIGSDKTIYIPSADTLYAVDAVSGTVNWKYGTASDIKATPALSSEGNLYLVTENGLVALNTTTQNVLWTYKVNGLDSGPTLGSNGTIYIGSTDYSVYAVNSSTGTQKWVYRTGDNVHTSPAVGSNGYIYFGSDDSTLYALNASEGDLKWKYKTDGRIKSSPAVGTDGVIYFGSWDKHLYALNPTDGRLKWKYNTGSIQSSPSIGPDGNIVVSNMSGNLYVLNSEGSLQRKFTNINESSPAIGANGNIYATDGYHLYALNASDSSVIWKSKNFSNIQTSPVIGSNGTIYVGPQIRPVPTINSRGKRLASIDSVYFYAIGKRQSSSIWDSKSQKPETFNLYQNYPNPFNPATRIEFSLSRASDVKLTVFSSLGKKVSTLINRKMTSGIHSVTFNAKGLPSGVYIYRLKADVTSLSRKMLYLK